METNGFDLQCKLYMHGETDLKVEVGNFVFLENNLVVEKCSQKHSNFS